MMVTKYVLTEINRISIPFTPSYLEHRVCYVISFKASNSGHVNKLSQYIYVHMYFLLVCQSIGRYDPQALVSELSLIQVDKSWYTQFIRL